MLMANIGVTSGWYHAFLETPVQLRVGALEINKNMLLWINDALMAVFFLLIGLEVKRELMQGSLASLRRGVSDHCRYRGMIVPALLYLAFNYADPITREGWAIPAATDIAFALGVLALLGSRVPLALKIFLMALAIIDDLGAIVIIALFYTSDLAVVAGRCRVRDPCHGSIESVRCKTHRYLYSGWRSAVDGRTEVWRACNSGGRDRRFLHSAEGKHGRSPAKRLEHVLHPWVAYLILPLFAFANAGVSLQGVTIDGLTSVLPLGIIAGLLIGKPLGISLFCWLALRFRMAQLPEGTNFQQIMAVGILCGIGFTMSIFHRQRRLGPSILS